MGAVETQTAAETVRRYFDATVGKDIDGMCACWAQGGIENFVGQQELVAPEGVRTYFTELHAAFPDLAMTVEALRDGHDGTATVQWSATGTFSGPGSFMGFEPTGARISIRGCDVLQVRDGLIVRNDAYFDGSDMARQLGLMPAQGSKGEERLTALANRGTRLRRRLAAGEPEQIAPGVTLLRGGLFRAMNVLLIEHEGKVTVFDAGEKGMAPAILAAAAQRGGIDRVVLGHADNDHRGSAPFLGAPVWCHPREVQAAQAGGYRDYWRMDQLPFGVKRFHSLMMDHVWEGGPVEIAGTVEEGDEVAGFRVVEFPGHAPGLIGLWRESDRVALVSDCFYMTSMWGRPQDPAVPLDAYNADTAQARESIRKLAALEPALVCPGHLGPLTEDVAGALARAASA